MLGQPKQSSGIALIKGPPYIPVSGNTQQSYVNLWSISDGQLCDKRESQWQQLQCPHHKAKKCFLTSSSLSSGRVVRLTVLTGSKTMSGWLSGKSTLALSHITILTG